MVDPLTTREGNLRFAGVSSPGYPADPYACVDAVISALAATELVPYGPLSVLVAMPPESAPPAQWECQVGMAVTGLPAQALGVQIEDYRGLHSISLAHAGPVRDLSRTYATLAEHARSQGLRVRPYWRVALRRRRLADGNILPAADVAVFIDR